MRLLPCEPAGNWMTAYAYIVERVDFGRRPHLIGDALQECLTAGHDRDCVEYARDMAAVNLDLRYFDKVAARRLAAQEAAA